MSSEIPLVLSFKQITEMQDGYLLNCFAYMSINSSFQNRVEAPFRGFKQNLCNFYLSFFNISCHQVQRRKSMKVPCVRSWVGFSSALDTVFKTQLSLSKFSRARICLLKIFLALLILLSNSTCCQTRSTNWRLRSRERI